LIEKQLILDSVMKNDDSPTIERQTFLVSCWQCVTCPMEITKL